MKGLQQQVWILAIGGMLLTAGAFAQYPDDDPDDDPGSGEAYNLKSDSDGFCFLSDDEWECFFFLSQEAYWTPSDQLDEEFYALAGVLSETEEGQLEKAVVEVSGEEHCSDEAENVECVYVVPLEFTLYVDCDDMSFTATFLEGDGVECYESDDTQCENLDSYDLQTLEVGGSTASFDDLELYFNLLAEDSEYEAKMFKPCESSSSEQQKQFVLRSKVSLKSLKNGPPKPFRRPGRRLRKQTQGKH